MLVDAANVWLTAVTILKTYKRQGHEEVIPPGGPNNYESDVEAKHGTDPRYDLPRIVVRHLNLLGLRHKELLGPWNSLSIVSSHIAWRGIRCRLTMHDIVTPKMFAVLLRNPGGSLRLSYAPKRERMRRIFLACSPPKGG